MTRKAATRTITSARASATNSTRFGSASNWSALLLIDNRSQKAVSRRRPAAVPGQIVAEAPGPRPGRARSAVTRRPRGRGEVDEVLRDEDGQHHAVHIK